ncbi:MAG: nucleotide exchange factor GrpE [Minisyncoccia bacterium]
MNDEQDVILDTEEGIDDSVLSEEAQGDTIKKLKDKLKDAESKAKENLDSWQRAQADFVNLRKRDEDAKVEFIKFAKSDLISQLIPVLDSFNHALAHGHKEVEPIQNQLLKILKQNNLEELNPLGEIFNPSVCEAVSMRLSKDRNDDHKILEVLQKGYKLEDRVIRPAKVIVGEYKE